MNTFHLTRLAACALLALGTTLAHASTDLVSAQRSGDVALQGTSLFLSTATPDGPDDEPDAAGAFNLSGLAPLYAGGDLELAAGLQGGELDNPLLERFAYEGSAATFSLSVLAGDTIDIDWQFFTRPHTDFNATADGAWLLWQSGSQRQLIELANALDTTLSATTGGWLTSGTGRQTLTAQESGHATLSFVVADVNGIDGSSQLAIHQISQTPAVPEPSTWLLLLGGLGLMGFMQRNRT
jgi:hypothetical protein